MKKNLITIMMMVFVSAVFITGCGGKAKEKVSPFTIPGDLKGTVQADMNGDGSAEEVGFEKIADEYISQELILTIDGKDYDLKEGIYFFPEDDLKCFMIRKDDKDKSEYIYIQRSSTHNVSNRGTDILGLRLKPILFLLWGQRLCLYKTRSMNMQ